MSAIVLMEKKRVLTCLSHVCTTSGTPTGVEASHVSRVIVHALNGDIACSEHGLQGRDERRPNDATEIARLESATGKDDGKFFTHPIDDIIRCCCGLGDIAAASYRGSDLGCGRGPS